MWKPIASTTTCCASANAVKSPKSPYQNDVLAALCRVLIYDVLTLRAAQHSATDRSARTVKRFYDLLEAALPAESEKCVTTLHVSV